MKFTTTVTLIGIVALAGVIVLLAGCDGDGLLSAGGQGGGPPAPGPGGADVPLGPIRTLQAGDTWNYAVTGVLTPNGGAPQALAPANGRWSWSTNAITFNGVDDVWVLNLAWPVNHPAGAYNEDWRMAIKQMPDGTLRLYGLGGGGGDPVPFVNPPYVELLRPETVAVGQRWTMEADPGTPNAISADFLSEGTEVIDAGGTTYECYRFSGVWGLGNFPINVKIWINPSVGIVRVTFTYDEFQGTTELTLTLQNTSFNP